MAVALEKKGFVVYEERFIIAWAVRLFLGYANKLEQFAKQMAGPVIRYPWMA